MSANTALQVFVHGCISETNGRTFMKLYLLFFPIDYFFYKVLTSLDRQ